MVPLSDAVDPCPLVGLVVNWEETQQELVYRSSQLMEETQTVSVVNGTKYDLKKSRVWFFFVKLKTFHVSVSTI